MKTIIIYALTSMAATLITYSQPVTRTITDTNGRPMQAKLVSKTDTTVAVIRKSDSAKFVIPLEKLSVADQEFIKGWDPEQSRKEARDEAREIAAQESEQATVQDVPQDTRSSSVSLRPNSGSIQRKSYPSLYQPRYSSGGGGGGGSRRTVHNGANSDGSPGPNCRLVRTVTRTTPGTTTIRSNPNCPNARPR